MKHKRVIKLKKSVIVPDIDEDDEIEDEEGLDVFEEDNFIPSKKVKKLLKRVESDWIKSYLIN